MNGTPGGTITIGTRLFFDGGLWEVTELTATAVVMRDALGGLRQASISGLLADPATRLLDAAPAEPAPAEPGTSGLTPPETEEMRRLAGHVLEVLTGYQRGGEALALPGEPRPQYAPGTAKLQRCQAKAAELLDHVRSGRSGNTKPLGERVVGHGMAALDLKRVDRLRVVLHRGTDAVLFPGRHRNLDYGKAKFASSPASCRYRQVLRYALGTAGER